MTTTGTATSTYAIDATHSSVEFTVRHLMITKVRGRFGTVRGKIVMPESGDAPLELDATIDVASIDTREEKRDAHLKSPDFFDADTHPHITFRSTSVGGSGADIEIAGDLTIHGTTKPVVLKAEFEGRAKDPWGGDRIAFAATTSLDRNDFGMTWNQALETGGVMVGKEIKVELNVQAVKQA